MEDNKDSEPTKPTAVSGGFIEQGSGTSWMWNPWNTAGATSTLGASQWTNNVMPIGGTSMIQWGNNNNLMTTTLTHCLCRDAVVYGNEVPGPLTFDFINGAWHEHHCKAVHPEAINAPDITTVAVEASPTSGEFLSEE